jgi:hypothetical protein
VYSHGVHHLTPGWRGKHFPRTTRPAGRKDERKDRLICSQNWTSSMTRRCIHFCDPGILFLLKTRYLFRSVTSFAWGLRHEWKWGGKRKQLTADAGGEMVTHGLRFLLFEYHDR